MNEQQQLEDLCAELWEIAEKRLSDLKLSASLDEMIFTTKEKQNNAAVLREDDGGIESAVFFQRKRKCRIENGRPVCPIV